MEVVLHQGLGRESLLDFSIGGSSPEEAIRGANLDTTAGRRFFGLKKRGRRELSGGPGEDRAGGDRVVMPAGTPPASVNLAPQKKKVKGP